MGPSQAGDRLGQQQRLLGGVEIHQQQWGTGHARVLDGAPKYPKAFRAVAVELIDQLGSGLPRCDPKQPAGQQIAG